MGMSRSDNYYDTVKGDLSAWTIICSKRNWFKFKRKFNVQLTHRGKTWIGQQKYTQVNTWWGIKLFIKLFLFQKKSHVHVPYINDRSQIISPMFLWIIHLFFLYKKGLSLYLIYALQHHNKYPSFCSFLIYRSSCTSFYFSLKSMGFFNPFRKQK